MNLKSVNVEEFKKNAQIMHVFFEVVKEQQDEKHAYSEAVAAFLEEYKKIMSFLGKYNFDLKKAAQILADPSDDPLSEYKCYDGEYKEMSRAEIQQMSEEIAEKFRARLHSATPY